MKIHTAYPFPALLLAAALLCGCGEDADPAGPASDAALPLKLSLLYTGCVHGYIEPCG